MYRNSSRFIAELQTIFCKTGKPRKPERPVPSVATFPLPLTHPFARIAAEIRIFASAGVLSMQPMNSATFKVMSGGQTGADRAALDWAIEHGIPHGGWCPHGRKAEDGKIDARYLLTETPSSEDAQRTEWNVRDSDATVVFSIAPTLSGGSKLTVDAACSQGKPLIHLYRTDEGPSPECALLEFIRHYQVQKLNVAGPPASLEPEIAAFVRAVLEKTHSSAREVGSPTRPVSREPHR